LHVCGFVSPIGAAILLFGHGKGSRVMMIKRRHLFAAGGGSLAAAAIPGKPHAESLSALQGLMRSDPPRDLPETGFVTADGTAHSLSDFAGRGMVVNLWATWCAPCVAEMPSLESLAKALAPVDIAVLPLSSDRGGAATVAGWFGQHGITGLPVLLDPRGALARAFGARGLPTTIIVNTANQEVARLEGAADWGTPRVVAMIRDLVGSRSAL
jgi:thiol-disulfide isomerase/thioredoxin